MADNRKYYYLKLKESYFDEDAIVLLESMQDGMLYSNILLKMYLKSLKNGGKLQLAENIPYTTSFKLQSNASHIRISDSIEMCCPLFMLASTFVVSPASIRIWLLVIPRSKSRCHKGK